MLADEKLNMHFPDGDIHDFPSFQKWYESVTNFFFDEKHMVQKIDIHSSTADQADLTVVVRWQASWWKGQLLRVHRLGMQEAGAGDRFGLRYFGERHICRIECSAIAERHLLLPGHLFR